MRLTNVIVLKADKSERDSIVWLLFIKQIIVCIINVWCYTEILPSVFNQCQTQLRMYATDVHP